MTETTFHVGTASWTDPTLLATDFYPRACKSAEARLRFYAERFDTVEVDSSFYALPGERNALLWANRTPEDFRFHIKAFAWLTGHEAETRALPKEIRAQLDPGGRQAPRIKAPSLDLRRLAFAMFRSALDPLRKSDKLGCLLFQFPPWFTASRSNRQYIEFCRDELPEDSLAIEFRHSSWFGAQTAATLAFLHEAGLVRVSVDAPRLPNLPPPDLTTTAQTGYVRLHGRNREAWYGRHESAATRFKYLYSDAELKELSARLRSVPARTVYILFNNCYADYGVRNASTMRELLR